MLLLPDAGLEGDIEDGEADPSVCHKLASWPDDLARGLYFQETAGSMDNQHGFRQAALT